MRYAAGHAAATRERLVELAAAQLRREGVAAVGVQPLMRAAGMTHGGFYQHFASREALLAAAVERAFAEAGAAARDGDVPDPHRALRRFVRGYLSDAHIGAPEAGCPLPTLAGEAGRLTGEAGKRYREGAARVEARVAALLAAADITHVPPISLLAELVGAVVLARLLPEEERGAALAEARAAVLERLGV